MVTDATKKLSKVSIGVGDTFGAEADAQLRVCEMALEAGVEVTPVWNKSNREHTIIGSDPSQTRRAPGRFLQACDFFTIDLADWIGKHAEPEAVGAFMAGHPELVGRLQLERVEKPLIIDRQFVIATANKFLAAVQEAARTYREIAARKDGSGFVAEISIDETETPQTSAELLIERWWRRM